MIRSLYIKQSSTSLTEGQINTCVSSLSDILIKSAIANLSRRKKINHSRINWTC
nr:MAG TPA: hypothetical protein [Caudoviricetes sp.]